MSTERTQIYRDILVTAIEGGINYWATVLHYKHDMHPTTAELGPRCHAIIVEDEDGAESKTIDTAAIRKAMSILHKGGGYSTRPGAEAPDWWKKKWRRAYQDCADGSWDYDASDADAVVQVACFGEVIYG